MIHLNILLKPTRLFLGIVLLALSPNLLIAQGDGTKSTEAVLDSNVKTTMEDWVDSDSSVNQVIYMHSEQHGDTTIKTDVTLTNDTNSGFKTWEVRVQEILAANSDKDTVATFLLRQRKDGDIAAPVIKDINGKPQSIKDIKIVISNAIISKITLTTSDGRVYETTKGVHLEYFESYFHRVTRAQRKINNKQNKLLLAKLNCPPEKCTKPVKPKAAPVQSDTATSDTAGTSNDSNPKPPVVEENAQEFVCDGFWVKHWQKRVDSKERKLNRVTYRNRKRFMLWYTKNKDSEESAFYLDEVLSFMENEENQGYYPIDETLYLNSDNDFQENITLNTDLNSYLDVRFYSDMLALFGKESNGLVQTDVSSRFTNHKWPLINTNFNVVNYIEPYFRFSKFDSQFAFQTVEKVNTTNPVDSFYRIDKLKFNQLAFIDLGATVNLLKLNHLRFSWEVLNVGVDYKFSDVSLGDSTNSNTTTLNAFSWFAGAKFILRKYKNFGIDIGYSLMWQNILNEEIYGLALEGSRGQDLYHIADISLYYHPLKKQNQSIFMRFRSVTSYKEKTFFPLLQVGYNGKLNYKSSK